MGQEFAASLGMGGMVFTPMDHVSIGREQTGPSLFSPGKGDGEGCGALRSAPHPCSTPWMHQGLTHLILGALHPPALPRGSFGLCPRDLLLEAHQEQPERSLEEHHCGCRIPAHSWSTEPAARLGFGVNSAQEHPEHCFNDG